MLSIGVESSGLTETSSLCEPVSTDTLGGVDPNLTTLPQKMIEGKAGGGRAVQWGKPLKASGLSHWQVSSPRLLRSDTEHGPRKPNQ